MDVETTKMSSRGQIVIPQSIRDEMETREGTIFAVYGNNDTIILKRIETPSKEKLIQDLTEIARVGKAKLEKQGIKESDIPRIVQRRKQ
jgi:AbrB family looped-hinge helix DNA binding protein